MQEIDLKAIAIIAAVLLLALGRRDVAPVPPGPDPGPDPAPAPDTAPFPCEGLTVLILEESDDRHRLTPGQQSVLFSTELRDWLDEHADRWRIWDDDVDLAHVSAPWPAAMSVPRDSLPWLLVSNGQSGYSGPLPESVSATVDLIDSYD